MLICGSLVACERFLLLDGGSQSSLVLTFRGGECAGPLEVTRLVTVEVPELAAWTPLRIAAMILARRSISASELLVFRLSIPALSGSSTASRPASKGLLATFSFPAQAFLQSGIRFQRGLQQLLVSLRFSRGLSSGQLHW